MIDRTQKMARSFAYADGVMVRQSLPSGLECYYDWESQAAATGPDNTRRVLRHWTNDGEHYDVRYDVHTDGGVITGGDTQAIDQLGRQYSWSWDARYNLTAFTDPLGRRWTMAYNANSQLLRVVNPGGDALSFAYNEHGLPIVQTDALGRSTRTMWDDRWFVPRKITLADGSSEHYDYDEHGNNTGVVDAAGNETRYAYDHHGLLVAITDAKGGLKRLAWNAQAQLSAYTDCSGYTTRYSYDGWTWLKSVTDAAGFTTLLTHDAMGRVQGVSTPDGAHERYHYDAAGQLVGITDALSRETRFALNTRGQLVARQDAEQRTVALTYDPAHRAQSLINENGERFEFIYDAADRMIEERRVGGTRVTIDYDANGSPVVVTHHPGIGDDLSALTADSATAHDQSLRTEFVRDAVGRLIEKRTTAHHYRYSYDKLDQLIEATKLKVINAADTEEDTPADLQPLHTTRFAYDVLGNLIAETAVDEITGETHALEHAHDPLGNRTRTELPLLPGQPDARQALNYLYYGSGHLHQINLSQQHGDAPAIHQLISDIERDVLHREISRSQGLLNTRFALDPAGRRTGAWSRSASLVQAPFSTQDAGWRRAIDSVGTAHGSALNGLMKEYRYDPVGELRQSRSSLKGATAHSYDATGRIEETLRAPQVARSATGPEPVATPAANHERFNYDPAGNLLDPSATAALAARTAQQQRGYVRDNLVRVFEDKRYFYDGHGRLIRKLSGKHTDQRFEWDDESRLTEVVTIRRPGTEHQTSQTTRFEYDAIGRRVAKHDAFGVTRFIWERMRLLQERRHGQVVSYVYEPDSYVPLARLDATGANTEAGGMGTSVDPAATHNLQAQSASGGHPTVAKSYQNSSNPANDESGRDWQALDDPKPIQSLKVANGDHRLCDVFYFHTDQVGLPEELTNSQGKLCWQANYKTWGSTVAENWEVTTLDKRQVHPSERNDKPELQQNLRFQGQYLDRDTGLHYNTFRFYDPDIGRFINPDPIGLLGGHNLQSYAPNPIAWIDPWGWLTFPPSSPELFPTTGGQRAIVEITMQGSRGRDFTAAYKEAGITKAQAKGYTWHHVDDFNPKTGKSTMQLVKTDGIHKTTSHKGSVSQFEKHFKVTYDSEKAVAISQKKGWLTGRAPKKSC